jgi:type IV fimbrial biogenesis protein FimT
MTSRRPSGFSLVELMATLGVLAIITAIAYPSMRDFIRRNRAVAQSNALMADLQYARGQAAATRSYVSICPRASATGTTCGTDGNYDRGWLVYTGQSAGVAYASTTAGATDNLQRQAPDMSGTTSVRASSGGPLTFNSRGELLNTASPGSDVNFLTCAKDKASDAVGASTGRIPGIRLNVAHSGRIASTTMAGGDACQ